MNELQTENEKPLLVVKYVWWRVLYIQFFNSLGALFGIGLSTGMEFSWHTSLAVFMFGIIGLYSLYSFLELIFFKELQFYHHKLQRVYYLFGSRKIDFKQKLLRKASIYQLSFHWYIFGSNEQYKLIDKDRIRIPIDLLKRSDLVKVNETLALISGRSVREIEELGMDGKELNPFIKQTQQGK